MVTQWSDRPDAIDDSVLGKRVDRATADIITGAAVAVYSVAGGRVLPTGLVGEVTTIIGSGANNAKFQHNPTTGSTKDLCANLDIDADEAGALYGITGIPGDAMLRGESGSVQGMTVRVVVLDVGDVEFISASNATGSISLQARYIPLDPGATLAAA